MRRGAEKSNKRHKAKRKLSPKRRTLSIPEAGEISGLSRDAAHAAAGREPPEIYTVRIGRRKLVPLAWLEPGNCSKTWAPKKSEREMHTAPNGGRHAVSGRDAVLLSVPAPTRQLKCEAR